ncbi:hypothetical protein OROMI_031089 [Orobanche minor]
MLRNMLQIGNTRVAEPPPTCGDGRNQNCVNDMGKGKQILEETGNLIDYLDNYQLDFSGGSEEDSDYKMDSDSGNSDLETLEAAGMEGSKKKKKKKSGKQ